MTAICMYFQVHQPMRLRRIKTFDAVQGPNYWDDARNREIMERAADKCYLPANRMLLELIRQSDGAFRVAFSISGTFLEQAERFRPDVIESFQRLAATGHVEFLAETYYHSLAGLWEDPDEFYVQVDEHRRVMQRVLGVTPRVFRNTELIYDDRIAERVRSLGYEGILTEGTEKVLGDRSPNHVYTSATGLPVLMKNYRLSDDIAFRFSAHGWEGHPLTADKYARWLADTPGETINLFMDYETLGEHQWKETGIFEFLWHLPSEVAKHPHLRFALPSEVLSSCRPVGQIDVPWAISWADEERDVSAWLGNLMQQAAFQRLHDMAPFVQRAADPEIEHAWRLLQTSDHLYYASTKCLSDGDVHAYFSPYDSPYLAYINHINAIEHLRDAAVAAAKKGIEVTIREAPLETPALAEAEAVAAAVHGVAVAHASQPATEASSMSSGPATGPQATGGPSTGRSAGAPEHGAPANAASSQTGGVRIGAAAPPGRGRAPGPPGGEAAERDPGASAAASGLVRGAAASGSPADVALRQGRNLAGEAPPRRALVTGGAGFIGSNLVRRLLADGWHVHVVDDLLTGRKENVPPGVPVTYVDVAGDNFPGSLEDGAWDVIVHLAGASSAPMFENEPLHASRAVQGFQKVLELARRCKAKVAFASTSSFYARCEKPYREDMVVRPATLYEFSKLAMEELAHTYAVRYGIDSVALRFFSVYGPYEQAKGRYANVLSQFLWSMRAGSQPVLYGDGEQTRDFTHVDDIVDGLLVALEHARGFDVYNIGTGHEHTFNDIVRRLNASLGTSIEPRYIPNPVRNYVHETLADTTKLRALGWRPRTDIDEGIRRLIALDDPVDGALLERIAA